MVKYNREYQHITFNRSWVLSEGTAKLLGQCEGLVQAISFVPIEPKHYQELLQTTFIKGAQSTTAIEGNTLTDKEIELIKTGGTLPPSKKYQEQEVKNILDAFRVLFHEATQENRVELICPELLLRFHKMIGHDLSAPFEAIPGRFRERDVVVGRYRCPDHRDVAPLVDELCDWLRREFKFKDGGQNFSEIIIQAIVTHIYIEWIHPFSDGNGRTGRLVEFYILLRGGLPNIALHLLSNHYNLTKPQYYAEIEKATKNRDLSSFIHYAALGLRDGLLQKLTAVQMNQFEIAWKAYIFNVFTEVKGDRREGSFKRRRNLALNFPIGIAVPLQEVPKLNAEIAFNYGAGTSERLLIRDLDELMQLEIIVKNENNKYYANIFSLLHTAALKKEGPINKIFLEHYNEYMRKKHAKNIQAQIQN